MTAKECIMTRRSIRQFSDKQVDEAVLKDIIETAAFAPSWKNTQITRYVAVKGELKDKIAAECCSLHANNGRIIAGAPMLIAVTIIKGRCGYERDGSFTTKKGASWQMFDAGIASQTFCLAAHELGLGTVIMGIFDEDKAAELIGMPEDREMVALIALGYPNEEPAAPKRKTVDDLLTIME